MKFPRMTIRRLMAAIVIAALGFVWGRPQFQRIVEKRRSYLAEAEYHSRWVREERDKLALYEKYWGGAKPNDPRQRTMEEASRLRIPYHAEMARRYRRAADRPWETMDPDPVDPGEGIMQSLMTGPEFEHDRYWYLDQPPHLTFSVKENDSGRRQDRNRKPIRGPEWKFDDLDQAPPGQRWSREL